MTFLGLEKPVEYGRQQIFDPTTANMVLNAQQNYINAVQNEYLRGLQDLKEFNKTYGDFITPILADQDWYNQNVTGKIRNFLDNAYKNGVDLLRSPEGRFALAQLENSIDTGSVAKLRSSAKNAEKFLESRRQLEAAGLYNPALAKYDGPDMTTYHTLAQGDQAGMGIWGKMSATPYRNMADFTKSYFDNIQPFERAASKNGISYSISEINPQDLYNIAEAHYNDLVSTPQGQLMYRMYKDQLGSDEAAKKAFNDAVVAGNLDRLRYSDNYNEMYLQNENLRLKKESVAIQRMKANAQRAIAAAKARGDSGGPGTQLQGISLARSWYDTAMAKAWSADGITKDWWNMGNNYGQFGDEAAKVFQDFGKQFKGKNGNELDRLLMTPTGKQHRDMIINAYGKQDKINADQKALLNKARSEAGNITSPQAVSDIQEAYRKQFSIPMDGQAVAKIVGTPLSENNRVARLAPGMVDKLYGTDDIISNTAGYSRTHTNILTKQIRDAIKKYGLSNTTVSALEEGYGSLRKNTGSFEVMPRVRIVCTDENGEVKFDKDAYVDISLGSERTKGGAYYGDYKEKGGAQDLGGFVKNPSIRVGGYNGPVQLGAQRVPGLTWTPSQSAKSYNMFPDYNRWTGFGVWDTDLTSSRLHAGQSEKLGTYGNPYETYDDGDDYTLLDIINE